MTIANTRKLTDVQITPLLPAECRVFLPCRAAAGDVLDISGNGFHAVRQKDLTEANLWSNAGFATAINSTTSGNQGGFKLPANAINWDLANGDSMMMAFEYQSSILPASTRRLMGTLGSGGAPFPPGLLLSIPTTGYMTLAAADGTNVVSATPSGLMATQDGSTRTIVITVDSYTKVGRIYNNSLTNTDSVSMATLTGSTLQAAGRDWAFGNADSLGTNTLGTIGARFRNIQAYVFKAKKLPMDALRYVSAALENPFAPMVPRDWK